MCFSLFYLFQPALSILPNYPIPFPMRSHFLLEPADKPGSSEKVFKIYEEWNGNVQLNEKTVAPAFLGKIHQNLRRFTGQGLTWITKKLTA